MIKPSLLVFDMDNTLLDGRVIVALAREIGFETELYDILGRFGKGGLAGYEVSNYLAAFLEGMTPEEVVRIVSEIPLASGAETTIKELGKRYKVAILSDSYTIAANHVKEEISADIVLANILEVSCGKLTGNLLNVYRWKHDQPGCKRHGICKVGALGILANSLGLSIEETVVIGDGPPDACAMRFAGMGIGFNPSPEVKEAADVIIEDMAQLLDIL
ncbi:MAG: haloacid dehalogenase-like hydrolase [Halobacteriota archaeon]|nr:haloacid dehalogenase-like hydrolase [Halobacteriota archaeon]